MTLGVFHMEPDHRRHHQRLDSLLSRLEHAKLRLDLAHSHTVRITLDPGLRGTLSSENRNVYQRALHAEERAVSDYLTALNELKAALLARTGAEEPPESNGSPDGPQRLSPRERQVLTLIASGSSSRQIADMLGIAFKTVVVHRYHIHTKLKAHNAAGLTRAAMAMGLIEI